MTRRSFVGVPTIPTITDIMQRTRSESLLGKNDGEQTTPRFSKPDVKDGMKTTRNGSPGAREQIIKRTRNTSAVTEENTVKNNRERLNKYWRDYYANNKERINQRLRGKKQTEIRQNITRFGACDQGSEKVRVETSPVPSDPAVTLCGISTQS